MEIIYTVLHLIVDDVSNTFVEIMPKGTFSVLIKPYTQIILNDTSNVCYFWQKDNIKQILKKDDSQIYSTKKHFRAIIV